MINKIIEICSRNKDNEVSKEILALIEESLEKRIDIETIIDKIYTEISEKTGIPVETLRKIRKLDVRYYRFSLIYLLHKKGYGLSHIGRLIGRDHSTVHTVLDEIEYLKAEKNVYFTQAYELTEFIFNKHFC